MGAPNRFETFLLEARYRLGAFAAELRWNWKSRIKQFRLHLFAFALFALGLLETVDPYALYNIVPERWQGMIPILFGVGLWLLRKVKDHPPVVTTTFHDETVTEPHVVLKPDEADVHRLDDDGGPHAPATGA